MKTQIERLAAFLEEKKELFSLKHFIVLENGTYVVMVG